MGIRIFAQRYTYCDYLKHRYFFFSISFIFVFYSFIFLQFDDWKCRRNECVFFCVCLLFVCWLGFIHFVFYILCSVLYKEIIKLLQFVDNHLYAHSLHWRQINVSVSITFWMPIGFFSLRFQ